MSKKFLWVILFLITLQPSALSEMFRMESATIAEINTAFDTGILTSEKLVQLYLNRINAYDKSGPKLNSIITLNPRALERARELDQERHKNFSLGKVR